MSEFPNWPRVEVEWLDITGDDQAWQPIEKMSNEPMKCKSLGYLAVKDEMALTLFSSLGIHSESELQGGAEQIIPMGCVVSITTL